MPKFTTKSKNKTESYWTERRRIKRRLFERIEKIRQDRQNLQSPTASTSSGLINIDCQPERNAPQLLTPRTLTSPSSEERDDTDAGCDSDEETLDHTSVLHVENAREVLDNISTISSNFVDDISDTDPISSSDDNSDESEDISLKLKEDLRDWATNHRVTITCLSDLLSTLQPHFPDLPKDARTLLQTRTKYNIEEKCGGDYFYFGVCEAMMPSLNAFSGELEDKSVIRIQINIDGLPLFKSSNLQLWPILGLLEDFDRKPFIIALFCGRHKPNNLNEYLGDFVSEVESLERNGLFFQGVHYNLSISAFLCDAPARAFVKNIKTHSGYHSCERCTQEGEYHNKVTFPETNAPPRTDESVRNMTDEDHHHGSSPLSQINIGLVTQFPLDYMHLVCLGVTRRIILLLMKGPLHVRQRALIVDSISEELISLRAHIPNEFARKPRSLKEVDRWKATEFRQFLLYTGPIVMRQLSDNLYKNFLLLFVGIFLLAHPTYCEKYADYSQSILKLFVQHFADIYGRSMIVYNIHNLVHLADDVKIHGCLDRISCFPFENFLGQLKRMIRKPNFPIQQIIRRVSEVNHGGNLKKKECTRDKSDNLSRLVRREHWYGPLPSNLHATCRQYQEISLTHFCIKTAVGDNCVKIVNDIVQIKNIITLGEAVFVVAKVLKKLGELFDYPLQASKLGIYKVSTSICNSDLIMCRVEEISYDYLKARSRLNLAEQTSDIGTDRNDDDEEVNVKRKRKETARYISSEDEENREENMEKRKKSVRPSGTTTKNSSLPVPPDFMESMSSPSASVHASEDSTSQFSPPNSQTPTPTPPDVSVTERSILSSLEEIKATVRKNTQLLQMILSANSANSSVATIPSGIKLPLESLEELDVFEEKIMEGEKEKQLATYLGCIGGISVEDATRRILQQCLTNELAKQMNWLGKNGKQPFINLRLKLIILHAIRKHPITAKSTDLEIETVIKNWLRYSKDRDGGRKKRSMEKIIQETAHSDIGKD